MPVPRHFPGVFITSGRSCPERTGHKGQLPQTLTGCGAGPRCSPRPSWPKFGGFGGLSRRQSPRTRGMQGRRGDNCQLSAGQWWHCGAGAGRKGPGSSVMLLFYLRCHSLRREMALFSLILLFRHACWFVLWGFFFFFGLVLTLAVLGRLAVTAGRLQGGSASAPVPPPRPRQSSEAATSKTKQPGDPSCPNLWVWLWLASICHRTN